ncbi:RNA dependent RNA polymerase-domain-containing protein [Sparassis latifolia]|uniref:RNA-dependent RNA polymerase n=1 Tax=Sparassis crispa TaxID=139825 RepID=A0A401G8C5_9APHY|nr:RdRP-domain-containing protein [Sparassis crispa]GBE78383.1 RdRP-domain-containing protein [Sparassis crispa]
MEIFMQNIGPSVTQYDLKDMIADVLHSPAFTRSSGVLNFEARIFQHGRRNHLRQGTMTLPSEDIGWQFLQEYGGPQPKKSIGRTRITFQPSRNKPNAQVLEMICRLPYVNQRLLREKEERAQELDARSVSIRTIQFGRECRDGVYSVEWEKHCVGAHLIFNQERKEFRVEVPDSTNTRFISIRTAQIFSLSASMDDPHAPTVFFSLNHPPAFESRPSDLETLMSNLLSMKNVPIRQRWCAFDDDHLRVASFTSLSMRLVCKASNDLDNFRSICRMTHTRFDHSSYPIQYRGLFSDQVRRTYSDWLSRLVWPVAFQVEALARAHFIDLKELLGLRESIELMVRERGASSTAMFLHDFASHAKTLFWYGEESELSQESVEILFSRLSREFLSKPIPPMPPPSEDNFDCLHVIVTPTTMYLEGPFPERSNRVMRTYPGNEDSFVRVSFADETRLQHRFDREVDGRAFVDRTIKNLLLNGVTIAGRPFRFLAYSQSALKEHAVWFVKPFTDPKRGRIDAPTIIRSLGSFRHLPYDRLLIYCPARYGARISQAFTATDASVSVEADEVFVLNDVQDPDGRWTFTDGVGTISAELARTIWGKLCAKRPRGRRHKAYPRTFQIRFMGSKGMLSVDYKLSGRVVCLRDSMIKFDAPQSLDIEIARAFDKPGRYYLNRPLIMILEGLGVPCEVFKILQDNAVRDAEGSVLSLERAGRLLEAHGLGTSYRLTSTMLSLHRLGVGPLSEDVFWQQMMDFAVNHVLRELKHHARIPVPDGWTLVGVADVHGFLKEGEIFACIDSQDHSGLIYLEGPTLISRSPTIHPGDVQLVRAIGRPPPGSPFEKESLRNSVVFSIKGARPLPSCLGGGDLDGDVYNVTTMRSLLPQKTYHAADYDPAKKKLNDHESTMHDVAEFVAEYINSDTLGIIAINWLIIADQSPKGILDLDCLRLAQLHSDAVDYPKSGMPVPLEHIPRLKFKAKPDWNAPETLTRETPDFYESRRAIGKLYRAIELPALRTVARASSVQRRHLEDSHEESSRYVLDEFYSEEPHLDDYVRLAVEDRVGQFLPLQDITFNDDVIIGLWELFHSYVSQLRAICTDNTLSHTRSAMLTEEEAVIGTIVAKCSQPRKRKDLMSQMREQTSVLINGMRAEISGDEDMTPDESLERAWIAYKVALIETNYFGARSFAWIALGEIFDAIRNIEDADKNLLRP